MLWSGCTDPFAFETVPGGGKAARMICEEIIRMIEEAKSLPISVGEKTNLYTDLGFDSLSFIQFLLKIEEAYSITFDIVEMEMCLQVDRLIALVEKKVKEHDKNHDQEFAAKPGGLGEDRRNRR